MPSTAIFLFFVVNSDLRPNPRPLAVLLKDVYIESLQVTQA